MKPERELQITHYAAAGLPVAEIGQALGVSRQRIDQLLAKLDLKAVWYEANVAQREVAPDPPHLSRVCHYCGRGGIEKAHTVHPACTRAAGVYWNRIHKRERYRTDPDYRQHQADYRRAHPRAGALDKEG